MFWGEAYLVTADGTILHLSELNITCDNVDAGCGVGKDYEGGRVTIAGNEYSNALPASPVNHDMEAIISLNLSGLNAVRFIGLIGADAFPGDESQRRKTYAVRTKGRIGRYITVVEPYEGARMIDAVEGIDENTVQVRLRDGRTQVIEACSIGEQHMSIRLVESRNGKTVREERAAGK